MYTVHSKVVTTKFRSLNKTKSIILNKVVFLTMCDTAIKFVQAVEKYPCLYNHNLADYARKDITEKYWNNIATEMNWKGRCYI